MASQPAREPETSATRAARATSAPTATRRTLELSPRWAIAAVVRSTLIVSTVLGLPYV